MRGSPNQNAAGKEPRAAPWAWVGPWLDPRPPVFYVFGFLRSLVGSNYPEPGPPTYRERSKTLRPSAPPHVESSCV